MQLLVLYTLAHKPYCSLSCCVCVPVWLRVQADVVNRGFGGYFTSWFVDYMLDDLFNVPNPTMAVLFLGTKDTLTREVSG